MTLTLGDIVKVTPSQSPGSQYYEEVVQQHGLVVQVELDGAVVHLDIRHLR